MFFVDCNRVETIHYFYKLYDDIRRDSVGKKANCVTVLNYSNNCKISFKLKIFCQSNKVQLFPIQNFSELNMKNKDFFHLIGYFFIKKIKIPNNYNTNTGSLQVKKTQLHGLDNKYDCAIKKIDFDDNLENYTYTKRKFSHK